MRLPRQVYAIRHNVTGRTYIGSSKDVHRRYAHHLCLLRRGLHPVEDMQRDYDDHGENYSFHILADILKFEERHKEYELMRKYNTMTRGFGYNYKDHVKGAAYK